MSAVINPYNFVPFDGEPDRKPLDEYYNAPTLTGWMDVTLIARSPVIVPDGARYREEAQPKDAEALRKEEDAGQTDSDKDKVHRIYGFFRTAEGQYAIPGSGLRGVLRSAYEAVTNSCLPFLMDNKPITQRVPLYGAFEKRGLLGYDAHSGHWTLYGAKEYRYASTKRDVETGNFSFGGRRFRTGDHIAFRASGSGALTSVQPYSGRVPDGFTEGWIQFNIPVSKPDKTYHIRALEKTAPL